MKASPHRWTLLSIAFVSLAVLAVMMRVEVRAQAQPENTVMEDMTVGESAVSQAVGILVNRALIEDDPYGFLIAGKLAAEFPRSRFTMGDDRAAPTLSAADMLKRAKALAGDLSDVAKQADTALSALEDTSPEQCYYYPEWYCIQNPVACFWEPRWYC